MNFDFNVEVKAKGGSSYTTEHINNRLAALIGVDTEAAIEEIRFLEKAKAKLIAKSNQAQEMS